MNKFKVRYEKNNGSQKEFIFNAKNAEKVNENTIVADGKNLVFGKKIIYFFCDEKEVKIN